MMYVTAMRLRSSTEGRGINIYLHLRRGAAVPEDPWKDRISDDPGTKVEHVSWQQVRGGGNSVEAFVDLVLNENDYSPELVNEGLAELERTIRARAPNPVAKKYTTPHGVIHVAFSVNLGLEDLTSKRRVFNQLRDALKRWQARFAADIAREARPRRAAG